MERGEREGGRVGRREREGGREGEWEGERVSRMEERREGGKPRGKGL